jgi:hypothetical protein
LTTGVPSTSSRANQAAPQLEAQRVQRQEADAESGHHRLLDGFVARHFHGDARREGVRREEIFHRLA